MFEYGLRLLLDEPNTDGIIVIGIHHLPAIEEDFVDLIGNIMLEYRKPIIGCDIGETEMAIYIRSRFEKFGIPAYPSPEEASQAMVALVNYGLYLKSIGCLEEYLKRFDEKIKLNLKKV
jgi:acyl-CoA synthetase (NDP forming)